MAVGILYFTCEEAKENTEGKLNTKFTVEPSKPNLDPSSL